MTSDRVAYAPSQEVGAQYPQIPAEDFKHSVQLVMPGGEAYRGAEAVFRTLALVPGSGWWLWLYQHLPGFAPVSELGYRFVADHRDLFYHLTKWTIGFPVRPARYEAVSWLFLRALALVYLCAFASLLVQVLGLIGARGILPAAEFLREVSTVYGARGHWMVPTVFWLGASDTALQAGCWIGIGAALLLLFGVLPRLMLALLFTLYLSFVSVGQVFLQYQWDLLLTETGFLALFLGTSRLVVWLFRWLIFRLYFLSAAVKLLSGDPTWRSWQALRYHYETQPLPTPLAWYMHHLPSWFQAASTSFVLVDEGLIAFLVFAPRRIRHWAAVPIALLQVLILLTGNYGLFNWLTLALCLFLLDDAVLPRWLRQRRLPRPSSWKSRRIIAGPAALLLVLTTLQIWQTFTRHLPNGADAILSFTAPFGIANPYGLFAVMTTTRPEIIVEWSNDGMNWQPYEFRDKPGDPRRAPPWVAPHLPRLDWQMWFAALSTPEREPWMMQFLLRLLQGSPEVIHLLRTTPTGKEPPRYIRARGYLYNFSDAATRRATGAWWTRSLTGEVVPPIGLRQ